MQQDTAKPRAGRGRGRPKVETDEEVTRRIVRTAYAILCVKGYAGMTMNEVAAGCGVSKKTLYRLFPGKLSLFRAITEAQRHVMIYLGDDLDDLPLAEALVKIFRMDLDEKTDEARRSFMRVVMMEAMQDPVLKQIVEEFGRDRSYTLVAAWLERQRARGRIAVDDIRSLTKLVLDIGHGAILHPAPATWTELNDRGRYLRDCFTLLARAIAPPPGHTG